MKHKRILITILTILSFSMSAALSVHAQADEPVEVITATQPIENLLPDTAGGIKASGGISQFKADELGKLAAEKAGIYGEYKVDKAASRQYGQYRADVFESGFPYAAFGLFSFSSTAPASTAPKKQIGFGSSAQDDGVIFWQGPYFVRVSVPGQALGSKIAGARKIAESISAKIGVVKGDAPLPVLVSSLPSNNAPLDVRYFLGPSSISAYVQHGGEVFSFAGDTAAVMAAYPQAGDATANPPQIVIAEYNTPQFASAGLKHAQSFISTLTADEQSHYMVKRIGNYVVEAAGVTDQQKAASLIDTISYPYTVKMLRDPRLPAPDPFYGQKAAAMLLSTFGIIGLMIVAALTGGILFGSMIFFKRRRQLQEVFSDAGGMLRLDIEPLGTGEPHGLLGSGPRMLGEGD